MQVADQHAGNSGDGHLGEAEQGRGGAGHGREVRQGARHGLGQDHPGADHEQGLRQDHRPDVEHFTQCQHGHQAAASHGNDQAAHQDLVRHQATAETDGGQVANNIAGHHTGKVQAELFCRHFQEINQHERRARQEGEQAGENQGIGQGVAQEADVFRNCAVVPQQAADFQGLAMLRTHGLGNTKGNHHGHHQGVATQSQEYRSPTQAGRQQATDGRRDRRSQGHDTGQDSQDFGGFAGRIDIPNGRPTQNRPGRTAKGLQETEQNQCFDVRRQCAANTGNGKKHETTNHDRFATKTVRQRTANQLSNGKAHQIQAQCQLNLIGAGAKV